MRGQGVVVLAAACALAGGCGKPTPADECRRIAAEVCKKLFQCDAAGAAQLGYTSQSDCETKEDTQLNCANAQASCNYDPGAVDKCLSDTDAQGCNVTSEPASCAINLLCPGQTVCSGSSVNSGTSGCTVTYSNCTDGHTYGASCQSGTCSCQLDGTNGKTFSTTTDLCASSNASKPIVQSNCGYGFQ